MVDLRRHDDRLPDPVREVTPRGCLLDLGDRHDGVWGVWRELLVDAAELALDVRGNRDELAGLEVEIGAEVKEVGVERLDEFLDVDRHIAPALGVRRRTR
jgi:hypothetical protein